MRWCDKNRVGYVLGFQKNDVLNRQIACEMTRARIEHACYGTKRSCFKWFRYRARSWDRHRWMIGKAEYGGKGANPAEMPIEQPTKYDFAVNLKTAKTLGITFPRSILLQATMVIE